MVSYRRLKGSSSLFGDRGPKMSRDEARQAMSDGKIEKWEVMEKTKIGNYLRRVC
jgi:hypothetical protein